jgi:hypothetical protein
MIATLSDSLSQELALAPRLLAQSFHKLSIFIKFFVDILQPYEGHLDCLPISLFRCYICHTTNSKFICLMIVIETPLMWNFTTTLTCRWPGWSFFMQLFLLVYCVFLCILYTWNLNYPCNDYA